LSTLKTFENILADFFVVIFRILQGKESSKEEHLFEIEIVPNMYLLYILNNFICKSSIKVFFQNNKKTDYSKPLNGS